MNFESYKRHIESYDSAMMLGYLCWYSVPESYVDHAFVAREMEAQGLDNYGLPPVPRTSDVFKRACTSSERKRVKTAQPEIVNNYLVREVAKDRDSIWRKVIREEVDKDGRKLSYQEIVELRFDRDTDTITDKWNPEAYVPVVAWVPAPTGSTGNTSAVVMATPGTTAKEENSEEIVAEIRKKFGEWNNALTSASVRELIRKILDKFQATVVRSSGSVYFVNRKRVEELEALARLVNAIPGGSFHILPLLDDRRQREMLKRAYEDECVEEIDRLLGEITEIKANKNTISVDRYGAIAAEYNRLFEKAQEYQTLLDDTLNESHSRLHIFQQTIITLMDNVK